MMKSRICLIGFLAAALCFAAGPGPQEKVLAFAGGTVVNPDGAKSLTDAVILVAGNRITAVGRTGKIKIPPGAEVFDLKGRWIIPGLIDSHIHFFQSGGLYTRPDIIDLRKYVPYAEQELADIRSALPDTFARYLRCGITSVLDMGGPQWNFLVRDQASKTEPAPRVFVAGPLISTYQPAALTTDDPPIIKVDTIADALRLVRDQVARQADFIKIWYIVRGDETVEKNLPLVKAVIDESHRLGKRVIVHATQLETARAAVNAGADILAHLVSDKPVDAEFIRLVKKRGVICSTTLVVNEGYFETLARDVTLSRPEQELANPYVVSTLFDLRHLPASAVPGYTDDAPGPRRERIMRMQRNVQAKQQSMENLQTLQKAGVAIAANTDAGNIGTLHGPALFREFALMAEAGLTPRQILDAGTIQNARLLGKQKELGTLEAGKLADFVVLSADPLKDIGNTAAISLVVKDGRVWRPEQIVKESAAETVQRQVNAYNLRDIDAFLAAFAPDVQIYDHPGRLLYSGHEEMRTAYAPRFAGSPGLHLQIVKRIVQGDTVVDQERITGLAEAGVRNAVVIYRVAGGKIRQAWIIRE